MIKRPHNYSGECVSCTNKGKCLWALECPLIDSDSRLKSHRKKGLDVRYLYGCVHYRTFAPGNIVASPENKEQP